MANSPGTRSSWHDSGVLRVRLSARGGFPALDLSQFVGNAENRWDDCVFFVNTPEEEVDVWFVSEDVEDYEECWVPPERVVFISSETSWEPGHYAAGTIRSEFLNQFAHIFTCHDVLLKNVTAAPPFLPWMINTNHGPNLMSPHPRDLTFFDDLNAVTKTHELSVFCSDQSLTANHRMRLDFVYALKEHFGDRLHWFGNGINPLVQKWPGIAPYRYTIVLENQATDNIFSEKIFDAYLGLSFPIYWGAPNLSDFFPSSAFAKINIRDLNGSIDLIETLLKSKLAEDNLGSLLEAKRRVLWEFNMFARLAAIARALVQSSPGAQQQRVTPWSWSRRAASERKQGHLLRAARHFKALRQRSQGF